MTKRTLKNYIGLTTSAVCVIGLTIALLYMQTIIASILAVIGLCTLAYTIYSFIRGSKVGAPHLKEGTSVPAPHQESEHKHESKLTLSAAKKMLEGRLVMRNSNTKQLISRHYQQEGLFPDSHGIGTDYAIPLWTIALPLPAFKSGDRENSEKSKAVIQGFVDKERGDDTSYLDGLSEDAAQMHLQDYVNRIKTHMYGHAPIGIHSNFDEPYNFEVLLAENSYLPYVDDFGRYSTGGRTEAPFNKETIAFRATLSQTDITFIKSILKGNWDQLIQSVIKRNLQDKKIDVIQTIRIDLSHNFAIDILTSKLVSWMNHNASPIKKVFKNKLFLHTLSSDDLKSLLSQTVTSNTAKLCEVFDKEYLHHFTDPEKYKHLLNANKHNADAMEQYSAKPAI